MTVAEDRAYDLMQSAHRLIADGEWSEAASALEQAATIHQDAGRAYDEARCLQLAATLRRSAGDAVRASMLAERAAAINPEDSTVGVSIAAEQAQSAFDQGRFQESIAAWDRAIDLASAAQSLPQAVSTLLRKRAATCAATGAIDRASQEFEKAAQLLESSGDISAAGFVRVEHAGMLAQQGRADAAGQLLDSIDTKDDAHLRAETLVLRAKLAREAGRFEESIGYATAARDAALQAVAPVSYFAAAGELAQNFDALGDFTNSYGALATAWATLGDLLGEGVAKSWVEPLLLAFKFKWGDEQFARSKKAYEDRHV